jgi:hypothetical protein
MKKLTMIALALLIAVPAFAVDYYQGPPPGSWQRGEVGTTFEHWTFDNPNPDGVPEFFDNPFGLPTSELGNGFEYGEWECPPELDPRGYVNGWHCMNPDGSSITLRIPNTEFVDGAKTIFIQITSSKSPTSVTTQGYGGNPGGYVSGTWPTGLPAIQWGGPAPFGGSWYTYNFGLTIRPNPQIETITITVPFCTVIDQIVVDTICTGTVDGEASTMDQIKALYR